MSCYFKTLTIHTEPGINLHNLTPELKQLVHSSGIEHGILTITSQHTTTAITINEDEARLRTDIVDFLQQLAPAERPYLHNDIHLRDCDPNEPKNAHSHLAAMMLGSSESIAINNGQLMLGQWQSVMMVELDGARERKVTVMICG